MNWTARAPGKLFLLGEYAVLDGFPAIVVAIDRFVEVRVESSGTRPGVRIEAPDLGAGGTFDSTSEILPAGPLRFVMAAYQAVSRRVPELKELGVVVETTDGLRGPDGTKIGLGGSAATTVATIAALLSLADCEVASKRAVKRHDGGGPGGAVDRGEVLAMALDAHARAQGTAGSGADVAASVYGDLLVYRRRPMMAPEVRALEIPSHLKLLVGWTGDAASTAGLVERYLGAADRRLEARRRFCVASETCVTRFEADLRSGRVAWSAFDANDAALSKLELDLDLGLHTPRLNKLIETARSAGAGAKLSGAGGGDCGIAITDDPEIAENVLRNWRTAGLTPLDLHVAHEGVTVRHEDSRPQSERKVGQGGS